MSAVIKLDRVTKIYGKDRGISDVSLEVQKGSIYGFLGPNGAGKTTTISMLVDLIRPTEGKITILDLDSKRDSVQIRRRIGFLAGDFALDEALTGIQALTYFANLHGGVKIEKIKELAERLSCDLNRQVKTLSRGNRQKVGLISALMHEPELLILDEPTSGLDPLIQAIFNEMITEHQKKGGTTFISSHALGEVQTLCDQMAFIRDGKLIAEKSREDLTNSATKNVRVISDDKKLLTALTKIPGTHVQIKESDLIELTVADDINPVLSLLGRHKVKDVTITEIDLEAIFMHYYEDKK